jgi:hypothetical protein
MPHKLTDDERTVLAELYRLHHETIEVSGNHKDTNPAQFVLRVVPMHVLNRLLVGRVRNLRATVNDLENGGLLRWEPCRLGRGRVGINGRVLVLRQEVRGATAKTSARWEGERAIAYQGPTDDPRGPLAGVTLTEAGVQAARGGGGAAGPVEREDATLARLRVAIAKCGANAKPDTIIRTAGVAEKAGRDGLRVLEEGGEYKGFARPRRTGKTR